MLPKFSLVTSSIAIPKSSEIKIDAPPHHHQGIDIHHDLLQIFPPSFIMIILGKPGSGKSHLISQFINKQVFFGKKYERILYIGPTIYPNTIQDEGNWNMNIDIAWILNKCQQCQGWAENILVIFDDVVSQLPSTLRNQLQNFFFTRRHIIKKGCVSIIFTTQKYTSIPSWMRQIATVLITFGISTGETRKIKEELNINKEIDVLLKFTANLTKHQFIICNLTNAVMFDYCAPDGWQWIIGIGTWALVILAIMNRNDYLKLTKHQT